MSLTEIWLYSRTVHRDYRLCVVIIFDIQFDHCVSTVILLCQAHLSYTCLKPCIVVGEKVDFVSCAQALGSPGHFLPRLVPLIAEVRRPAIDRDKLSKLG